MLEAIFNEAIKTLVEKTTNPYGNWGFLPCSVEQEFPGGNFGGDRWEWGTSLNDRQSSPAVRESEFFSTLVGPQVYLYFWRSSYEAKDGKVFIKSTILRSGVDPCEEEIGEDEMKDLLGFIKGYKARHAGNKELFMIAEN
jgi:hypothetical protein